MTPWRMIPALVAGAAWATLAVAPGRAAEATFRVGEQVVLRGRAPLWVDGHVAADTNEFRLYRVERVNGDKLWLVADNAAGWARIRQVQRGGAAIREASRAIEADPSAYHYPLRALIWDALGKLDLAIADDTEALRIEPDNRTGLVNRGLAWSRKHEPRRAIADLDAAIRLDPLDPDDRNAWGWVYHSRHDDTRAILDFTEAIRLDPRSAGAFENRGWARHARGDYAGAAADYAESARLAPDQPSLLASRAWQWATCPDEHFRGGPQAVAAATHAVELAKPDLASPRAALAAAYAEVGDLDRAVEWQEQARALTTDPADRARAEARLATDRDGKPVRDAP